MHATKLGYRESGYFILPNWDFTDQLRSKMRPLDLGYSSTFNDTEMRFVLIEGRKICPRHGPLGEEAWAPRPNLKGCNG